MIYHNQVIKLYDKLIWTLGIQWSITLNVIILCISFEIDCLCTQCIGILIRILHLMCNEQSKLRNNWLADKDPLPSEDPDEPISKSRHYLIRVVTLIRWNSFLLVQFWLPASLLRILGSTSVYGLNMALQVTWSEGVGNLAILALDQSVSAFLSVCRDCL